MNKFFRNVKFECIPILPSFVGIYVFVLCVYIAVISNFSKLDKMLLIGIIAAFGLFL